MILLLDTAPGGYGLMLLQTLFALAGVCVLAWVVLRWGARRGFGGSRGRVKVLERVPLEGKRCLYVVTIGERVLLLGAGDHGAPRLLTELDPGELPPLPERTSPFADLFARMRPASGRSDRELPREPLPPADRDEEQHERDP